jgi:Tol biopolymer transport system component
MVYIVGPNLSSQQSLFWLDAAGNAHAIPAPPREYVYPRFSPDGTRIALGAGDASGLYIAVYELAQNRMTKLTFWKGVSGFRPVWAPDGKHVLFLLTSSELAGPGIYWIRSDGAGEPQRLIEGRNVGPSSFTPDGKHLAYLKLAQNNEIWTVQLDLADPEHPKTGKPELFLGSKFDLRGVAFSPDGRWIAYRSAESGQPEVFVRPFPGPGGKWQVSTAGGSSPIWSPNGHELFYQGRDMMVVAYSVKDESFVAGQPRPWSEKTLPIGNSFDLAPDGKRFVVVMPATSTGSVERLTHVEFLMNFSDELQRKVPIGK